MNKIIKTMGLLAIAFAAQTNLKAQTVTTVVNSSYTYGNSGNGGAATAAYIGKALGINMDASGNLYLADYQYNVVRKVDASGTITNFAGSGSAGFAGDGGSASASTTKLNYLCDIVTDGTNAYIVDRSNNRIRKVNSSGTISTFAGDGAGTPTTDGADATATSLYDPSCITEDGAGNIYVGTSRYVFKINTSGKIYKIAGDGTTSPGSDGAAATTVGLNWIRSLTWGADSRLYISDVYNNMVRSIDTNGYIHNVAGKVSGGSTSDSILATSAQLSNPTGIVFDNFGNLYISNTGNNNVKIVNTSGYISTLVGTGTAGNHNGRSDTASLHSPWGLAINPSTGSLYIADENNSAIRMVTNAAQSTSLSLTVKENSTSNSISSLLAFTNYWKFQTITWSVLSTTTSNGGTLSGFPATATVTSSGGTITPSGLTYTPASCYSGNDHFVASIYNGYTTTSVTVNVYVTPSVISGPSTVCVGSTITLTDSLPSGTWSSSDAGKATVNSSTGIVSGVAQGVVSISYDFNYGFGYGCAQTVYAVSVNAAPNTISGSLEICAGIASTLTNSSTGGTWTSSDNTKAFVDASTGVTTGISQSTTGVITYSNGCGSAAIATLTVDVPVQKICASATPNVISCGGSSTLEADVTGGTSITYSWAGPSGYNSTASTPTVTPSVIGVYTVSVTSGVCPADFATTRITVVPCEERQANNGSIATNAISYNLYPNPGTGFVTITQNIANNETNKVRVINTLGELVYNGSVDFVNGKSTLDLSNVETGVYLMELVNTSDKKIVFSLVIEK